jgi:NADH-quinone oxidoreductase subunit N
MNALIISAVWGVIMMFTGIFLKQKSAPRFMAITGLVIALGMNFLQMQGYFQVKVNLEGMMEFDKFSLLFIAVSLTCTLLYVLISGKDIEKVGLNVAEYFALLFFIMAGICMVVSYTSLLMLFLGIEIVSIPLYILAGSDKRNLKSNEASLKYFLMGAFSTGIMLLGIALLYGANGNFTYDIVDQSQRGPSIMSAAGLLLLLISMSFKVSAAPFHFWTPDVYDGAPTVFTSFMATIVKAAAFVGFIRLFDTSHSYLQPQWKLLISIIIAATLLIGNLTAVFQQSVKRMLAYSSIAQAGFMMFALFVFNEDSKEGMMIYAVAYSLATIGIFAVLMRMKDYTFDGFNGLAKQQPLLAAVMAVFLLSLAGIPLTAGFIAKFNMLMAVMNTGEYLWLVILAVLCAAISVYYYFRLIQAMYFKQGDADITEATPAFRGLLVLTAAILILLGIFPQLLKTWIYF